MDDLLTWLPRLVALLALALAVLALWNGRNTSRLRVVTAAQYQRAAAYNALAAMHYRREDPAEALAAVAEAEEALEKAEARLPRRSRATRAYLASKEK